MTKIIAIRLISRNETSKLFQNILSEFGCYIKTRIGLPDIKGDLCSNEGVILLEFLGNENLLNKMKSKLLSINELKINIINI